MMAAAPAQSVDMMTVDMEEKSLHTPPLQEIAEVLRVGLTTRFEDVAVTAAPCPDLTEPPFRLAATGLSGNAVLVELGGPPYLVPRVQRDKVYDLRALLARLRRERALLVGAGAGPWPLLGVNCEGVMNLAVAPPPAPLVQGSRAVRVSAGAPDLRRLPDTDTRTALLGNYLVSDGSPGEVIKVVAKVRTGDANFITAIRETLTKHYGDKVMGLGGVFVARSGRFKYHVMPDFSETDLTSEEEVNDWLNFYEYSAPLTNVGTLVTGDLGLDLRVQHFHGWSEEGGVGGHYHEDVTPAAAHYEGYFVPARAVLRLDRPKVTHQLGRD